MHREIAPKSTYYAKMLTLCMRTRKIFGFYGTGRRPPTPTGVSNIDPAVKRPLSVTPITHTFPQLNHVYSL